MAYNVENLSIITNNVKSGVVPTLYQYWDEDGDTVTGAGFFVDYRLNVGDIIQVLAADFTALAFYRVSAVADGAATVLALTSVSP